MWGVAVAAVEDVAAALALLLLLLLEDEEVVEVLIDMRFGGLRGEKNKYFKPSQDEFRFFCTKRGNVTFPYLGGSAGGSSSVLLPPPLSFPLLEDDAAAVDAAESSLTGVEPLSWPESPRVLPPPPPLLPLLPLLMLLLSALLPPPLLADSTEALGTPAGSSSFAISGKRKGKEKNRFFFRENIRL